MKSNILFLLIDSFRADYFHEHKKSYSTHNFDQLIKKGIVFETRPKKEVKLFDMDQPVPSSIKENIKKYF